MKAAVIRSFDQAPVYGEFDDPLPTPDEIIVTVSAAALTLLAKSQASGKPYPAGVLFLSYQERTMWADFPAAAVYFGFPRPTFGAMAERVPAKSALCVGADEVISLDQPPDKLTEVLRRQIQDRGVDVIVDCLWGPSAERVFDGISGRGDGRAERRIRYVQIGAVAAPRARSPRLRYVVRVSNCWEVAWAAFPARV